MCIYIYIYIHTYIYIYLYLSLYIYVYIYIYVFVSGGNFGSRAPLLNGDRKPSEDLLIAIENSYY